MTLFKHGKVKLSNTYSNKNGTCAPLIVHQQRASHRQPAAAWQCRAIMPHQAINATIRRMQHREPSLPAAARTMLSLVIPPVSALVVLRLSGVSLTSDALSGRSIALGTLGLVSWFMGLAWYRIAGMGLRGRRPLYAGIGFAVLGWLALLLVRFFTVAGASLPVGESTRTFIFLLIFEAFCTQLWAFGLLFRSVADWRGPLTGVLVSGAAFGIVGWLFFGESAVGGGLALLFFAIWGFYYALIRLRTGSVLGMVIIQPLQTLTTWHLLVPAVPPNPTEYAWLYLVTSLLFGIFAWRLWPRMESDYRI